MMNASMIFDKGKSKKNVGEIRKSKIKGFGNTKGPRGSKTFVENIGFRNNLGANDLQRSYILNPCIESKEADSINELDVELPTNVQISQSFRGGTTDFHPKSDSKNYEKQNTEDNKGRCTTNTRTNGSGMGERAVLTTSPEEFLSEKYCSSPAEEQ